jgi:hypothetical protein
MKTYSNPILERLRANDGAKVILETVDGDILAVGVLSSQRNPESIDYAVVTFPPPLGKLVFETTLVAFSSDGYAASFTMTLPATWFCEMPDGAAGLVDPVFLFVDDGPPDDVRPDKVLP